MTVRTASIRPTILRKQLSQTGTGTIGRSSYGKQIRNKVCWSRLSGCPDHSFFIALKLCGIISWSWVWVLSPLWITAVLIIVIAVIAVIVVAVFKER